MRKTRNTGRDSLRRLPWFKLTNAGVNFENAYFRLADLDRKKVLDILLEHAFLPKGTDAYRWWQKWNIAAMQATMGQLLHISAEIATLWHKWASEINETRASRVACREAILGLVSNLARRESLHVMVIVIPAQCDTSARSGSVQSKQTRPQTAPNAHAESEAKITD